MRGIQIFRRMALTSGSVLATVALACPAHATQSGSVTSDAVAEAESQANAAVATPPAPPASAQGSDDIVVTAQRREQNLNDIGMTVLAVGRETIQDRQITDIQDIAALVPGLTYTQSVTLTPVFTIRGVGFYESTLGVYPAVSVYLDEVPLPLPALTALTAFDLERIETLKGPQGTLFGNNATGGAINYVASRPSDQFHAGFTLGYGRFDTITGDAYITGPVTSTMNIRLAGRVVDSGDWQRGFTTNETSGATRSYAGRMLVDWEPTPSLRFQLNLNAWNDRTDPQVPQFLRYAANIPFPTPIETYPRPPEDSRAADFSPNAAPRNDATLMQAALRADYDITSNITLTSLTSYIDYERSLAFDGDGVTFNDYDVSDSRGAITSFSQELRLSQSRGRFRWVVGANYSADDASSVYFPFLADSTAGLQSALSATGYRDNQRMRNYAGFANAELDIGQITLKGGARYTRSTRDFAGCGFNVEGGGTAATFTFLQNLLRSANGLPPGPTLQTGDCYTINDSGPNANFLAQEVQGRLAEDNISFRTGIDWRPNPSTLLYANIARGYKAGSFPATADPTNAGFVPVTQESLLSYELGARLRFLGGALQANASLFYYDYTDKQLRSKVVSIFFGQIDALVNIPRSSVRGAELELIARPTSGLSVYANFLYLDATVDSFTGYGGDGRLGVYDNTPLPYAPRYTISTGFNYEWLVSNRLNMFVGADLNFRSSTTSIIGSEQASFDYHAFDISDYATLDLRAGVESADGRWRLLVWGKNITNEYYWNNVFYPYDTISRYTGRPVTYGASLSFRY